MRDTSQSSSTVVATERQYLYVLKKEFPKLGFFIPKKDKCDECVRYENLKIPRDEGDFKVHIEESKLAQNSKKNDKERAKQNPEKFLMAVFDFQKILILPFGEISSFYYTTYIFIILRSTRKRIAKRFVILDRREKGRYRSLQLPFTIHKISIDEAPEPETDRVIRG